MASQTADKLAAKSNGVCMPKKVTIDISMTASQVRNYQASWRFARWQKVQVDVGAFDTLPAIPRCYRSYGSAVGGALATSPKRHSAATRQRSASRLPNHVGPAVHLPVNSSAPTLSQSPLRPQGWLCDCHSSRKNLGGRAAVCCLC